MAGEHAGERNTEKQTLKETIQQLRINKLMKDNFSTFKHSCHDRNGHYFNPPTLAVSRGKLSLDGTPK